MSADADETEDAELCPTWFDSPRGFIDMRSVEAISFNDLVTHHLNVSVTRWTCDATGWAFEYEDATVIVGTDQLGSLNITATSEVMPRKYLDGMRLELRQILRNQDDLDWSTIAFAVTLLQLTEAAEAWRLTWKNSQKRKQQTASKPNNAIRSLVDVTSTRRRVPYQGYDGREVRDFMSIIDNPFGVNIRSLEDPAVSLLGESMESICARVSEDFRILHVEPVFRKDLVSRFLKQKDRVLKDLLEMSHSELRRCVSPLVIRPGSTNDTIEGLASELAKPSTTFHGASRRVVESIVRYGFVVPGTEIGQTGTTLEVSRGSSYGKGIYSSPDPMIASYYLEYQTARIDVTRVLQPCDVPGARLIICATLMGRAMTVQSARGETGPICDSMHSHVSPDGLEYIVFQSPQILPCYVLHLDYGAEHARTEFQKLADDPGRFFQHRKTKRGVRRWEDVSEPSPGEIRDKKQALKAAAKKWFPYGYGPAHGTNFVIEDIADVSDDEETFGDFQNQRIEQEGEIRGNHGRMGVSWFDEYQLGRKTDKYLAPP
ncbi:hypothetical protein LTR37_002858 [Vermiconidia calcicola]|uniref:Uncharacterized protein n=1 Tax=Vermiconidia calcicola TaxID=1690605 RepID=A0ACC3NSV7_9PEZI|nr:hypothetical protein LTR37_002858 [Vermiconidia calcicola]